MMYGILNWWTGRSVASILYLCFVCEIWEHKSLENGEEVGWWMRLMTGDELEYVQLAEGLGQQLARGLLHHAFISKVDSMSGAWCRT
jgi:hypothetical protein